MGRRRDDDYDVARQIPTGARVVVRVTEGVDPTDHRMKFRDYVGHVSHGTATRWNWCVTPRPTALVQHKTDDSSGANRHIEADTGASGHASEAVTTA